jgi:hypothetical protein
MTASETHTQVERNETLLHLATMDAYSRPRPSRKQDNTISSTNTTHANNTNTTSRLRPVADALDTVGFPSKGDKT